MPVTDIETTGLIAGFCGLIGSLSTAVAFLWKMDAHIDKKIARELKPIFVCLDRQDKEAQQKALLITALSDNYYNLREVIGKNSVLTEELRSDIKEMAEILNTLVRKSGQ